MTRTGPRRCSRPAAPLAVAMLVVGVVAGCGDDEPPAAVGTIERERVELIAEAAEPIVAILAREGQRVAAGDVVLELDDRRLAAEVTRVEGAHARAVARLAELERGPRRERIAEGRAALAAAEGVLERDRREWQRVQSLFRDGIASRADLDAARARYEDSLGRRDQAAAALEALLAGTTDEEITQAEAAVTEARGALEAVRISRERLHVRAPVGGVVDALPFELGDRPPAGAVVAVLLAHGAPYARVYVPEPLRARVRPGTAAVVRVDGLPDPFTARVRSVAQEATFTPFFALTEEDRGRLVYVAEVDLVEERARTLPTGLPAEARFEVGAEHEGASDD